MQNGDIGKPLWNYFGKIKLSLCLCRKRKRIKRERAEEKIY
jgi:hypothetical protein